MWLHAQDCRQNTYSTLGDRDRAADGEGPVLDNPASGACGMCAGGTERNTCPMVVNLQDRNVAKRTCRSPVADISVIGSLPLGRGNLSARCPEEKVMSDTHAQTANVQAEVQTGAPHIPPGHLEGDRPVGRPSGVGRQRKPVATYLTAGAIALAVVVVALLLLS